MTRLSRRQCVVGAGTAGLGLLGGCGRLPLPGAPQAPAPVRHIGVLSVTAPSSFTQERFDQGPRELGRVDGQNIAIDWRAPPGDREALAVVASELVRLNVDVLVVQGQGASDAAQTERVRATLAERLRAQQRSDGIHVVATALLAVASR